jgi:hypothetical protein
MTLQTGKNRHRWRRAVTCGLAISAVAAGAIAGIGAPKALADPASPTPTQTDNPPAQMTADEALAIIDRDYDTGAGGGQLSTLIHDVLKLRAQGFKPSNANKEAITKALDYRPNQEPLIEALKATLAYQHKMQALAQNAGKANQQPGYNTGGGLPPGVGSPALPPGVPADPGAQNGGVLLQPGPINQPIG